MIQIRGQITFITYEKLNFRVVKLKTEDGQTISAKGPLGDFGEEEPLTLHGDWEEYVGRNGQAINQFVAVAAFRQQPADLPALEKYLAHAVPGCGPQRAKALVNKHKQALFNILQTGDVEKLIEVKGIGAETAKKIADGFREKSIGYHICEFLCSLDISPGYADRIQQTFGSAAVSLIRRNPYLLVRVSGIGFPTADKIARKLGWAEDSPERAEATLLHVIAECSNEGHCYLPRAELIDRAVKELNKSAAISASDSQEPTPAAEPTLTEERLVQILNRALDAAYEKRILVKDVANTCAGDIELVYPPRLYNAEVRLARKIRILLGSKVRSKFTSEQLDWIVRSQEKGLGLELTDEQRAAVIGAFTKPISILTGGPGTGKTACMRVLVNVAKQLGISLSQCAPTGRAAKHLSTVTGEPALTIHRLLLYDSENDCWGQNESNPLATDLVIADEFSMVDVDLAYRLFEAVAAGTPILLIGDKDQLPAVSPGRVLDDLINSKFVPVTRLTKIFRQAEQSLIVQNAYRILKGQPLIFPDKKAGAEMADCYLIEPPVIPNCTEKGKQKRNSRGGDATIEDYEWIKRTVLRLCQERIPARLQVDPVRDIQVLTPMKKKALSVNALNEVLQDALNPKREGVDEVILGDHRFRTGDRVQQHRNNYRLADDKKEMGVYNGDIGFIEKINAEDQTLTIQFGDRKVVYPFVEAKNGDLQPAYAMTIHKCQGGEFPVIIIVLTSANFVMLQRNLLYTADTRAQKLLVFVSLKKNIMQACRNAVIHKRNSFLAMRLRRELEATKAA